MNIWVEKYRPKTFEDVIGLPEQIRNVMKLETLPHLLLIGTPGTGKTTVARIIIDILKADSIELNASDERGIDVIREQVKLFCMKMSDSLKIVLLDESDSLTADAQQALRRLMEQYSSRTRFIFTGNYFRRFIEPITSRCSIVEFGRSQKEDIYKRLEFICKNENLEYTEPDLNYIVNTGYPDIRRIINLLSVSVVTKEEDGRKVKKIDTDNVTNVQDISEVIWQLILQKNLEELRDFLSSYPMNYDELYTYIFNKVWELNIPSERKYKTLLIISNRAYKNTLVADREINFVAGIIEMTEYL